jgi:hypothetical protein
MKKSMLAIIAAAFAFSMTACHQQVKNTGTCHVDGKYGGAQTTTAEECAAMNGRFEG